MNDLAERFVKGVWVPLPHTFRREVREATEAAFVGKNMITTLAGSTVLLEDVVSYNQKAEGPLVATFQTLSSIGHSGVAGLIQELYPGLVPYFIGCGSANPVHHTSYVLQFLAVILADEKEHETPVRVAMLAALFHDVALGLSKLPKITEAHIEEKTRDVLRGGATIEELKKYRNDAVKARKEHMQKGAEIAEGILTEYKTESKQLHKDQFNLEDLPEIKRIIEHHDDPKIPLVYSVIRRMFNEDGKCEAWRSTLRENQKAELDDLLSETGAAYLIKEDDWILQLHHEADLLWMVTQDGIDADLARFSPAEKKTPRELLENNKSLHRQEMKLYKKQQDFDDYRFRGERSIGVPPDICFLSTSPRNSTKGTLSRVGNATGHRNASSEKGGGRFLCEATNDCGRPQFTAALIP